MQCLLILGLPWEFSLFTRHLWKLLGSKEIKVLADVTFLAALCVSTYTEQSSFPVGDFSSKPTYLCLCFSACTISSNGTAQVSKATKSREHISAFNCLCRTSCLECLPTQPKDFGGCWVQALMLLPWKELVCCQTFPCEALNFYSLLGTVFCIIMTLSVCCQVDLSFWTVDLVVVMGSFLPPLDLATRV